MTGSEGVTYSFKDLFDKLDKQLSDGFDKLDKRMDDLNRRLDSKADNTYVAAIEEKHAIFAGNLEDRLNKIHDRFKPLEDFMVGSSASSAVNVRWLLIAAGIVTAIIGSLIYLAASGVH